MKTFFKSLVVLLVVTLLPAMSFAGSQVASGADAADIISYARYYLNEPNENVWDDDDELLEWINHGTMDIVARSQCLEYTEDIALVASQLNYPIIQDYIFITAVIYNDTKGLIRGNPQSLGNQFHEIGEPNAYFVWNDEIWVYPKPDTDAALKNITLFGVERPAELAALTDAILVPAHYDKALVYYVVAQAFSKVGQFSKAQYFTTLYMHELDRYRTDYNVIPKEPLEIAK
jgi:hypothetical protein